MFEKKEPTNGSQFNEEFASFRKDVVSVFSFGLFKPSESIIRFMACCCDCNTDTTSFLNEAKVGINIVNEVSLQRSQALNIINNVGKYENIVKECLLTYLPSGFSFGLFKPSESIIRFMACCCDCNTNEVSLQRSQALNIINNVGKYENIVKECDNILAMFENNVNSY